MIVVPPPKYGGTKRNLQLIRQFAMSGVKPKTCSGKEFVESPVFEAVPVAVVEEVVPVVQAIVEVEEEKLVTVEPVKLEYSGSLVPLLVFPGNLPPSSLVGDVSSVAIKVKEERAAHYVENRSDFDSLDSVKKEDRYLSLEEGVNGDHSVRVWFRAKNSEREFIKDWGIDNKFEEFKTNLNRFGLTDLFGSGQEALRRSSCFFGDVGLAYDETWDKLDHAYLKCLFEMDCMLHQIRQSYSLVHDGAFTVSFKIIYNKANRFKLESLSYFAVANYVESGVLKSVPLFFKNFPITSSGLNSLVQFKPDLINLGLQVDQEDIVHDRLLVYSGWQPKNCAVGKQCSCVYYSATHHFHTCGNQTCSNGHVYG